MAPMLAGSGQKRNMAGAEYLPCLRRGAAIIVWLHLPPAVCGSATERERPACRFGRDPQRAAMRRCHFILPDGLTEETSGRTENGGDSAAPGREHAPR